MKISSMLSFKHEIRKPKKLKSVLEDIYVREVSHNNLNSTSTNDNFKLYKIQHQPKITINKYLFKITMNVKSVR